MTNSSKKIYTTDFKNILRSIPEISLKERQYLEQVFKKDLEGGLTEYELKERIRRLKNDLKDPISSFDADKVQRSLLSRIKGSF